MLFDGFGHHATIIIALVLIVSRGLSNSAAIELIAKYVIAAGRSLFLHISILSAVAEMLFVTRVGRVFGNRHKLFKSHLF